MAGRIDQRPIQPLSPEAIAQIKSSITITSLNDVVLNLVKNSLDAKADKIDVTVHPTRGTCTVEDNGSGIAPAEFLENGGLGKLYHTSKNQERLEGFCYGRNGTFLASVGALSFLSITSHHIAYRSQNTLILHLSHPIARYTPAPAQYEIPESHGTKVAVRDLFGNMPVRVKHRAIKSEEGFEDERQWNQLKRSITGVLLAWRGDVTITIKGIPHNKSLRLSCASIASTAKSGQMPKAQSREDLRILSQAGYIGRDLWSSWVPLSGATSKISVNGAISTEPAPTKQIQFISFGIEPLFSETSHNELYDFVNKMFSNSSFGAIEDDVDIDENDKERWKVDRRFKVDGYTNRQLKPRKGIDRWPMFVLQISNNSTQITASRSIAPEDQTNLEAITEVLSTMLSQWLTKYHFRPRNHGVEPSKNLERPRLDSNASSHRISRSSSTGPNPGRNGLQRNKSVDTGSKRKISSLAGSVNSGSGSLEISRSNQDVFSEWSRIKSGRPEFYTKTWSGANAMKQDPRLTQCTASKMSKPSFTTPTRSPSNLAAQKTPQSTSETMVSHSHNSNEQPPTCGIEKPEADLVIWTDPRTTEKVRVDSRTGVELPQVQRLATTATRVQEDNFSDLPLRQAIGLGSVRRLTKRPETGSANEAKQKTWFSEFLGSWNNPVFQSTEERIRQALPRGIDFRDAGDTRCYRQLVSENIDLVFQGASTFSDMKISKAALVRAEVIAQVDRKFILVKLPAYQSNDTILPLIDDSFEDATSLLLIDQHAADERCKVEDLLADLCTPDSDSLTSIKTIALPRPIKFEAHSQELQLFHRMKSHFARWGIVYDIITRPTLSTPNRAQTNPNSTVNKADVAVRALPPTISERCRLEPKRLVDLLRTEIWKLEASGVPKPSSAASQDDAHDWLRRVHGCPQGILDLINSRACRSAIMFNDELSMRECRDLVQRLAKCVFPFQCAHGRPSLVPLVGLAETSVGVGVDKESSEQGECFGQAWRKWRESVDNIAEEHR
ncbi:MAG: DNA mismatch repair protein [Bogoriella megaspora]|nr:MAG: DNA mismatch repair protein [Bogoriella megaspora]